MGLEIEGEGRGSFLRRMKRDLYTADGKRFREKVFIERSSEIVISDIRCLTGGLSRRGFTDKIIGFLLFIMNGIIGMV